MNVDTFSIASSSEISDSDATVLCDSLDNDLALKIEEELKQSGCKIAISLCAGRTITKNLISKVKHSQIVIVLLSNGAESFWDSLEFLDLERKRPNTTLILYEAGFKQDLIKQHSRNIIRVQRLVDPIYIAQEILLFICGQPNKDHQQCSITEIRRAFIDNLIDFLLVPSFTDTVEENVQDLKQRFENSFGLFTELNEGEFESYFDKSIRFSLINSTVNLRSVAFDENDSGMNEALHGVSISSNEEDVSKLVEQLGEIEDNYSFFLIVGNTSQASPNELDNVLKIPWLRVFDFGINSSKDGLLSQLESKLKERRTLSISSVSDVVALSPRATDWCLPLGEFVDSNSLESFNSLEWYSANQDTLVKQLKDIANFCTGITIPIVMILWYDCTETQSECLEWLLSLLYANVSQQKTQSKVIFCTDKNLYLTAPIRQLIKKFQLLSTTNVSSLSAVCSWMGNSRYQNEVAYGALQLPSASSKDNKVEIPKQEVAWIGKMIEMLPLCCSKESTRKIGHNSVMDFLKGGTVSWHDISSGTAIRDLNNIMQIDDILTSDILKERKSLMISVYHEPGSGGTTLGRQLLWCLHKRAPCGVVLSPDMISMNELAERVKYLQQQTSLPVVLLVDGKNDKKVDQIMKTCMPGIVVIYIQRYYKDQLECVFYPEDYVSTLSGNLSKKEAEQLRNVFTRVVPQKSKELQLLTMNAEKEGETIYNFEYGLTAFNFEFRGIRNYVRGYLQLPLRNANIMDMLPWQRVVSCLSLALHYGQSGLPSRIFAHMLEVQDRRISLADMECYACKQFIQVQRSTEGVSMWKIRYYPIAKEILEQVLSNSPAPGRIKTWRLSESARINLHHLVIDFIRMVKNAVLDQRPPEIVRLLSKIILGRSNDMLNQAASYCKQDRLSRLLEHIPNSENKVEVLRELSQSFPDRHQFHAHLGRLLSNLGQFIEAEFFLEKAIKVFYLQSKNIYTSLNALSKIHNMYGYACLNKVKFALKQMKNGLCAEIFDVLKTVQKAVLHFTECREHATYNYSYGYIGEVKVRLVVTKYIAQTVPGGCLNAFQEGWGSDFVMLQNFVHESHSICAYLLNRCHYLISPEELQKAKLDFQQCQSDFICCFEGVSIESQECESISYRRSRITCLKLGRVNNAGHYFLSVDKIPDGEVVLQIITLHEENIRQALFNNEWYDKIDIDVLEWLDAIRHRSVDTDYSLEESVLPILNQWDMRSKLVHSTFYRYSVTFILLLYSRGKDISRRYKNLADELKKDLLKKSKNFTATPINREVLVKSEKLTIRKLSCADQIGSGGKGKRHWVEHSLAKWFQVCTGTIVQSSGPHNGSIKLDFPRSHHQVYVSFTPIECDLVGKQYSDEKTKVEFFVLFNVKHGAEAVAVKKLRWDLCGKCGCSNYIITLNQKEKRCVSCAV